MEGYRGVREPGHGALAAAALPVLILRRKDPLVPPSLFRSRNFTVANLATFVIYGALYVSFTFQGLFLIGTIGYNEPAAGLAGLPATLFIVVFSTRFGKLAARYGPRLFMALGPAVMGSGLLWLTRFPADGSMDIRHGGGTEPHPARGLFCRRVSGNGRVRDGTDDAGGTTHHCRHDFGPQA